ncbi:MAG TPA: hypothetical protein DIW47_12200 [Bacteroidetes bacterium]|nr:hypothetical protein [Bacteroidota bacterium]
MKKIIYRLCLYSHVIVNYTAIVALATVIVWDFSYGFVPKIVSFLFWLIGGVWLGFNMALKANRYLSENKGV